MTQLLPEPTTALAETLADLPEAPPEMQASLGAGLLRALGLSRPKVPRWITDPNLIASIEAGFIDIPDEAWGDT